MLETAWGAGAGDALTATTSERAATSAVEDSMAGEWTWQSAETSLAFYSGREVDIVLLSNYSSD